MEGTRTERQPHGRTVRGPGGYRAFVPAPLPPVITWDAELVGTLSRADQAIGRLAGESWRFPNPHPFVRPFLHREAVLSSGIEGTRTTLEELLAAGAGVLDVSDPADLHEVGNYAAALEYGLDRLEEAGIVSLVGSGRRNRVYCARAMLEILNAPQAVGRSGVGRDAS